MKKMVSIMILMSVCMTSFAQDVTVAELTPEVTDKLTSSYQQVAFNLFNELAETEDGNICFSPLSAQIALLMLQNGAGGNTLSQMQKVLGTEGASSDAVNLYNQSLIQILTYRPDFDPSQWRWYGAESDEEARKHYEAFYPLCEIANALWNRPDVVVNSPFTSCLQDYYDAGTGSVAFSTQEGIDYVNGWVNEHTHGLIPQLYAMPQSPDLALVLANSLYLKAAWAVPFWKELTTKENFYKEDGTVVQTDMMFVSDPAFRIAEVGSFKCVRIPYSNLFYMTVFMPADGYQLPEISYNDWIQAIERFAEKLYTDVGVNLKLPKYEIEGRYDLIPALKSLGMTDAFMPCCDFKAVCNKNLPISAVYQLDKIKVDEEGTEAAAVTVIEETESVGPSKIVDFFVDKPFYFTIENLRTNTVLFMGKVTNPTGGNSGQPTQISDVPADGKKTEIFDLSGRPLRQIPEHGFYIRNGRKFLRR